MPITSDSDQCITSPHDRITILEDLIDYHCERNAHGAGEILRIAASLDNEPISHLPADDLRDLIMRVRLALVWLGHELAIDRLDNEATQAALGRSHYIPSHPSMLS